MAAYEIVFGPFVSTTTGRIIVVMEDQDTKGLRVYESTPTGSYRCIPAEVI